MLQSDYFGNYEGSLPEKEGRNYYEFDIDSDGDMECAERAGLTGIRYRSGSLLACVKGRL